MNVSGMAAIGAALVLCAGSLNAQDDEDEVYPQDESVPSEDCVSLHRVDRTEILDERNILFHMRGGAIYRNVLPRRCPGLDSREAIAYEPRMSRLCDLDTITVLTQTGAGFMRGPSCGLGKFYPVTEAEAEAIREEAERVDELGLEN